MAVVVLVCSRTDGHDIVPFPPLVDNGFVLVRKIVGRAVDEIAYCLDGYSLDCKFHSVCL